MQSWIENRFKLDSSLGVKTTDVLRIGSLMSDLGEPGSELSGRLSPYLKAPLTVGWSLLMQCTQPTESRAVGLPLVWSVSRILPFSFICPRRRKEVKPPDPM